MTAGGRPGTSSAAQHTRSSAGYPRSSGSRAAAVTAVTYRSRAANCTARLTRPPRRANGEARRVARASEPGKRRGQPGEAPGAEADLAVRVDRHDEGLLAALRVPGQAAV